MEQVIETSYMRLILAALLAVYSTPMPAMKLRHGKRPALPVSLPEMKIQAKEILGDEAAKQVRSPKSEAQVHEKLLSQIENELPQDQKALAPSLTSAVLKAAYRTKMDPFFLAAVIKTESGFRIKARGRHGEIGLMQLRPKTAAWIAKKEGLSFRGPASLEDAHENIRLGAAYLSFLRSKFKNRGIDYVAAYNMGAGQVRKLREKEITPRIYHARVSGQYLKLRLQ